MIVREAQPLQGNVSADNVIKLNGSMNTGNVLKGEKGDPGPQGPKGEIEFFKENLHNGVALVDSATKKVICNICISNDTLTISDDAG